MPSTPLSDCEFWDFSLRVYAAPGVEAACLRLQRQELDVVFVLFCAWLGVTGREFDEASFVRLAGDARHWSERVLIPLRDLRRSLKSDAAPLAREAADAVRADLLRSELAAERAIAEHLAAGAKDAAALADPAVRLAACEVNFRRYLAVLGRDEDEGKRRDFAMVLAASFPDAPV